MPARLCFLNKLTVWVVGFKTRTNTVLEDRFTNVAATKTAISLVAPTKGSTNPTIASDDECDPERLKELTKRLETVQGTSDSDMGGTTKFCWMEQIDDSVWLVDFFSNHSVRGLTQL